jgi:hypothetical protein
MFLRSKLKIASVRVKKKIVNWFSSFIPNKSVMSSYRDPFTFRIFSAFPVRFSFFLIGANEWMIALKDHQAFISLFFKKNRCPKQTKTQIFSLRKLIQSLKAKWIKLTNPWNNFLQNFAYTFLLQHLQFDCRKAQQRVVDIFDGTKLKNKSST